MSEAEGSERWISAADAVAQAASICGDSMTARHELRGHATAGLIRTRAARLVASGGRHLGADVDLPATFWSAEEAISCLGYDPIGVPMNWDIGHIGGFVTGVGLAEGYDVRFAPSDLERWFPQDRGAKAKARVTSAPQPKWDWEPLLIELTAKAEKDGLLDEFQLHKRGGQAQLEAWMRAWFAARNKGEHPSESQIRIRAAAIRAAVAAGLSD
jgi:hypothetical protein